MDKLLSPKQVARAIGVSEASLKRWCDRGVIEAVKTAGGHRRLTPGAVVRYVREAGISLVEPEVLGLPATTGSGDLARDRARERAIRALETGSEEQFGRVLFNLYLADMTLCEICDEFIAGAFAEIGERWQHGSLEVYQERRAVEICTRWIHHARSLVRLPGPDAPLAIGGTIGADPYTLATAMVELVLREAGWNAQSFGVGLPVETLCAAVRAQRPTLVWVSASSIPTEAAFITDWQRLAEAVGESDAALVLGGRGVTEELRRALTFAACCDNLRHLVAFASTLFRRCAESQRES